ncbi:MAG: YIP1 family protein [Vulcanimicrobiaceae bacterium]
MSSVWDILVAPRSAFAALHEQPRWAAAFAVAVTLATLGALLQTPAREHVAGLLLSSDAGTGSALASMSEPRREQAQAFALGVVRWEWVATPLLVAIALGVATLVLLGATALARRGSAPARPFALAANVAVVFGIGQLALAAIMLLRGSNDFTSDRDLATALPSLAWFAPQASSAVTAALAQVNPFALWACGLLVLGLSEVTGSPLGIAVPAAVLVSFGGAAFAPLLH